MAKETQLLTSRWLLLVAIGLAVAAAIAVNVYITSFTSQYENRVVWVVQVTKEVPLNGKVNKDDVRLVRVPEVFAPAFKQAFDNVDFFIGGRPTRRKLSRDDVLFHGDFMEVQPPPEPIKPPAGYEYVNMPIAQESTPGQQLQPGGYVSVRGRFVVNPGAREKEWVTMDVFECIQVKTLDDSTSPLPKDAGRYARIGVFVKRDQAKALVDIKRKVENQRFEIAVVNPTNLPGRALEPVIEPALLKLVQGGKGTEPEIVIPE